MDVIPTAIVKPTSEPATVSTRCGDFDTASPNIPARCVFSAMRARIDAWGRGC